MKDHLIDYRLLRLIVGAVALSLGTLTNLYTEEDLRSISASYHQGARDFFVGSLCFIGAFLCVYQGYNPWEAVLAKIAGLAAIIVAFVPTAEVEGESAPVHYIAAAIVFLILTYFCFFSFRSRARKKEGAMARVRVWIYTVCGCVMLACILAILGHSQLGIPALRTTVYWGETIALVAFGIAWITAGKVILADGSERLRWSDCFR